MQSIPRSIALINSAAHAAQAQNHKLIIPSILEHNFVLVGQAVKVLQMGIHGVGVGLAKSKLVNSKVLVQGIHLVNATIQN